jgi:hypothetical protein
MVTLSHVLLRSIGDAETLGLTRTVGTVLRDDCWHKPAALFIYFFPQVRPAGVGLAAALNVSHIDVLDGKQVCPYFKINYNNESIPFYIRASFATYRLETGDGASKLESSYK